MMLGLNIIYAGTSEAPYPSYHQQLETEEHQDKSFRPAIHPTEIVEDH